LPIKEIEYIGEQKERKHPCLERLGRRERADVWVGANALTVEFG